MSFDMPGTLQPLCWPWCVPAMLHFSSHHFPHAFPFRNLTILSIWIAKSKKNDKAGKGESAAPLSNFPDLTFFSKFGPKRPKVSTATMPAAKFILRWVGESLFHATESFQQGIIASPSTSVLKRECEAQKTKTWILKSDMHRNSSEKRVSTIWEYFFNFPGMSMTRIVS